MTDIKSEIYAIFDGPSNVAAICGVTPSAVSQWDEIPTRHLITLNTEARKIGVDLNLDELLTRKRKNKQ